MAAGASHGGEDRDDEGAEVAFGGDDFEDGGKKTGCTAGVEDAEVRGCAGESETGVVALATGPPSRRQVWGPGQGPQRPFNRGRRAAHHRRPPCRCPWRPGARHRARRRHRPRPWG